MFSFSFSMKSGAVSFLGVVGTLCGVAACSAAPAEEFGTTDQSISSGDRFAVGACLAQDARRGPNEACDFTIQCGPGLICEASAATDFKSKCVYKNPGTPSPQRAAGESCDESAVESKCAAGLSCGSNSATRQYEAAHGRLAPSTCQSACLEAPCASNADCSTGDGSLYCARTSPTGGEYAVPFCDFRPSGAQTPPSSPPPPTPATHDACASLNDATYCGQSTFFHAGEKDTLYTCKGHKIVASQACASGCEAFPDARLDVCKPQCTQSYNGQTCSATVTTSCYVRAECTAAKEYYDVWKDSCGGVFKTRVASVDSACK